MLELFRASYPPEVGQLHIRAVGGRLGRAASGRVLAGGGEGHHGRGDGRDPGPITDEDGVT